MNVLYSDVSDCALETFAEIFSFHNKNQMTMHSNGWTFSELIGGLMMRCLQIHVVDHCHYRDEKQRDYTEEHLKILSSFVENADLSERSRSLTITIVFKYIFRFFSITCSYIHGTSMWFNSSSSCSFNLSWELLLSLSSFESSSVFRKPTQRRNFRLYGKSDGIGWAVPSCLRRLWTSLTIS